MTESSFTFLKVRGIRVGAHWSWLFVFALLAWSLATAVFPNSAPGLDSTTYLGMGIVSALLFFASILLHELGHAFQALKEGMRIDGITLWLFGGVARFMGMFPSAGAELRIAVAGPAVSVFLGATFMALAFGLDRLGAPEAAVAVAGYLGRINLIVVAFNLVPALPLDGGRILRAWLWYRRGSFSSATTTAARGGQAFAIVLISLGVLSFFTRATTGGVWFVFLGWFLLEAARAEAAFIYVRQAFGGVRVRDLMTPDPLTVSPNLSIGDFFGAVIGGRGHSTYPVVDGDRPVGLMTLRLAGTVPPEARDRTLVGQVMLSGRDVPVVSPDVPMLQVVETLRGTGPGRALVLENGSLVGIVSVSDIARALEIERARGDAASGRQRGTAIVWVLLVVALLSLGLYFYRPPLAVVAPGPAVDISNDVRINGVPVDKPHGKYLLTSVDLSIDRPNALAVIYAIFDPNEQVIPVGAVLPPGEDEHAFFERQKVIFRESQMTAAAAAAQAAGLDVSFGGTGAKVLSILEGSSAARVLRRGDVIVAIDGRSVVGVSDVREMVSTRPIGTRFVVGIERAGARRDVEVTSRSLQSAGEEIVGLGLRLQTRDFKVNLPFEVSFREREIGGPSAGLAYALAITDMLDPGDLARGRTIAATGTIDADGRVGPIGGIDEKAVGAREAGAKIFLVPTEEAGSVSDQSLDIRGVATLDQALRFLRALA